MFTQWYKGNTPKAEGPPPWTGGPVSLHTGYVVSDSGAGELIGYVNNMRYGERSNTGTIQTQYFRDLRTGTARTVKLIGLVQQQIYYIVLAWELVPDITPTLDMPPMTYKLRLDGTTVFDFTGAPAAGVSPPSQAAYLSHSAFWTADTNHTIEFI